MIMLHQTGRPKVRAFSKAHAIWGAPHRKYRSREKLERHCPQSAVYRMPSLSIRKGRNTNRVKIELP